ncbi:MAG: hypothetical protein GY820_01600 [Gammaproteobacteria bacterium]|nr:hypothetical protein [Gammaproteobacteria bacterium]
MYEENKRRSNELLLPRMRGGDATDAAINAVYIVLDAALTYKYAEKAGIAGQ